jgi:hypothetical protein
VFLGVVLAGMIGLRALARRWYCRCWPLRSSGSTSSPTPAGQLFNCFNARSGTVSAFRHLLVNRWLWGAIALSVVIQIGVVHLGLLNTTFGTVPLSWDQWLICIAMGSVVLWFSELRKLVIRSLHR